MNKQKALAPTRPFYGKVKLGLAVEWLRGYP